MLRLFSCFPLLVGLIFCASAMNTLAADFHAAHAIAKQYLKATILHDWESAVKLVDKESLENVKAFQTQHLKNAPTQADEEKLLRLLSMKDVEEIHRMTPADVYIRRGKAQTKMLANSKNLLPQMRKTLSLQTLATGMEGKNLVHATIRRKYVVDGNQFSELAYISLTGEGTVWKVSLDAQEPTITPVKK